MSFKKNHYLREAYNDDFILEIYIGASIGMEMVPLYT